MFKKNSLNICRNGILLKEEKIIKLPPRASEIFVKFPFNNSNVNVELFEKNTDVYSKFGSKSSFMSNRNTFEDLNVRSTKILYLTEENPPDLISTDENLICEETNLFETTQLIMNDASGDLSVAEIVNSSSSNIFSNIEETESSDSITQESLVLKLLPDPQYNEKSPVSQETWIRLEESFPENTIVQNSNQQQEAISIILVKYFFEKIFFRIIMVAIKVVYQTFEYTHGGVKNLTTLLVKHFNDLLDPERSESANGADVYGY